MQIILSPAKKMISANDDFVFKDYPVFLKESKQLLKQLKSLSKQELKDVWKCSDKLVEDNYMRLKDMDLKKNLSPAIFSYVGLAYQHLAPSALTQEGLDYLQEHLSILSGLYGVLKPFDGIRPYRLEMQAILPKTKDLYSFWQDKLYKEVNKDHVIINLASKEYSLCVEKYIQKDDCFLTIDFMEESNGKLIQKGTHAKMARGEMVYWLAENQIENREDIKQFNIGYIFDEYRSTSTNYIFLKNKK